MEPQTGQVRAWVGGINYKHFQYDHVYQGARQVGSTFKPFVYATAIDQLKLSPCDTLPVSQITIPVGSHGVVEFDWTPKNSGGEYSGYLSLKAALAKSVNTISARLMDRIGPAPIVRLAEKMGIESNILPVASIALGSVDLKLSEMVGAYSTFANKGIYTKPVMITSIEDKNGTVLYQFVPETKDVISKEAAYVTINLMEGVTQFGSGARLRTLGRTSYDYNNVITGYPYGFVNPIAGKTGTTQNQSDGWFMGIVPNLCTGVWVGGDDRATHFETVTFGQGATMALPIWGLFMKKCYADKTLNVSTEAFEQPENLSIAVDCNAYRSSQKQHEELEDEFGF
ncbi:penicillin-binding transpeptidase domain-containing protein [Tritonibacter mobilis]|nr:penicillin-binding transpeptidase domain-containing protein [Tritonibacter mobilis]